jgi:hypothetical protein
MNKFTLDTIVEDEGNNLSVGQASSFFPDWRWNSTNHHLLSGPSFLSPEHL